MMKKGMISILPLVAGVAVGVGAMAKVTSAKVSKIQALSDKHLVLFRMMNQWVKVKQEGKHPVDYLEREGYKNIAVYGISYAGETLIEELKDTGVHVAYGIDKKGESIYADVEVFSLEDELEPVDAVVVTAITFFNEIEQKLSKKLDCEIISLEDILYEV